MNERLSKKISIYNFLFTVGIVIYHSKNFYHLYTSSSSAFFDRMYDLYYSFVYICMGFFFMISAYLFYIGLKSEADVYKKMKKRLFTIGIPFLVWNLLVGAYEILYSIIKGTYDLDIVDYLLGLTIEPFNGPLWYLVALMVLMLIAPLIYKLKEHPNVFLGVLAGVIVLCCAWRVIFDENDRVVHWFMQYLPLYFIGAYFGLCKSDFVANEKYNYKLVSIVSAVVSVLILVYFVFLDQGWILFGYVLSLILPVTIWLSTYNSMFERFKLGYPVKASFFVYVMHMTLIGIFNTIITKVFGYGSMHPVVVFLAYFVFVAALYAVCLVFAYVAGKILPEKLYFALSGGRVKGGRAKKEAEK